MGRHHFKAPYKRNVLIKHTKTGVEARVQDYEYRGGHWYVKVVGERGGATWLVEETKG